MTLPHGVPLAASQLQAAWAPTKERLFKAGQENDLRVRVHRATSALEQAERHDSAHGREAVDAALVFRWIGLNALYGRWDHEQGLPVKDRRALDMFTSECARLDRPRLESTFEAIRDPAEKLVESPFVEERFWKHGDFEDIRPRRGQVKKMRTAVREQRVGDAIQRTLMVVYFLRCQIVHGAATLGSSLNRETVKPAADVLRVSCGQFVALAIEHGLSLDWGSICYPPVKE